MSEPGLPGLPVGIELLISPSEDAVILRVQLAEVPKEGEPLALAVPADSAVALALGLLSCVKELRRNDAEILSLLPHTDPSQGN